MDRERINDIIDNATDLKSVYDKLTDEELKGMSFEEFEKLVNAVPAGDDEELSDEQMEAVAGGIAGIDDIINWFSKLGKKEVKKLSNDIDRHVDDTINDIIGPGM